ncbi:MAG: hypothetical protein MK179_00880 [Pirellulaceae bacterium]|nr:hypothetical protein [Pirellulaceae bacterium]
MTSAGLRLIPIERVEMNRLDLGDARVDPLLTVAKTIYTSVDSFRRLAGSEL